MSVHTLLLPSWIVSKSVKISIIASGVALGGAGIMGMAVVETKYSLMSTAWNSGIVPGANFVGGYLKEIPKYVRQGVTTTKDFAQNNLGVGEVTGYISTALTFIGDSAETVKTTVPSFWDSNKGTIIGTIKQSAKGGWSLITNNIAELPGKVASWPSAIVSHDWTKTAEGLGKIWEQTTITAISSAYKLAQAYIKSS